MFIYPYKKGSKSARVLGKALGFKVLTRPRKSRLQGETVINWGSNSAKVFRGKVLNYITSVQEASNKLVTFEVFKANGIECPDYTTDIEVAKQWIIKGKTVVCRTLLRSHSGKGIVIASKIEELVKASLYVKYFPKTYEFRVHVFNEKVIDSVQKRKRSNVGTGYNKYIRSHNNGWVFCRDNNKIRDEVKTLAVDAVKALGLDFGAVDICMSKSGICKVLEVNTAPALVGSTLKSYVKAIRSYVNVQNRG